MRGPDRYGAKPRGMAVEQQIAPRFLVTETTESLQWPNITGL